MTWTPDKIPKWLRRTPEQQAKDARYQHELRTALGPRARPTPTEAQLIRAAAVRLSAEAQLAHLSTLPQADPLHIHTAQAQLAEALAMQGHFADAAKVHPIPEQAEYYDAVAAAIERDDNEPGCGCPSAQKFDAQTNRNVTEINQTISALVFSHKHNRMMPLVQCVKCGDMNVKPAPAALGERILRVQREQRQERARRRGQPDVTA